MTNQFETLKIVFPSMFQQQKMRREEKLAEDKEFLKEIDRFEEKNEIYRVKAR